MEKRIKNANERYDRLEEEFNEQSGEIYRTSTAELDHKIRVIMKGEDEDFLERAGDLGEERDLELGRLKVRYDYMMNESFALYNKEIKHVDAQHESSMQATHERVVHKLEQSLKRFRDDRSLYDISNDGLLEVGDVTIPPKDGKSKKKQGNNNGNGSTTTATAINGNGKKRRRNVVSYDSGGGGGGGSSDSQQSERNNNIALGAGELSSSVANFLGEMDVTPSSVDLDSTSNITQGRNKQALKYLTSLKSDEMNQDLDVIRRGSTKK